MASAKKDTAEGMELGRSAGKTVMEKVGCAGITSLIGATAGNAICQRNEKRARMQD